MTQQSIEQGNKIIAEFMNVTIHDTSESYNKATYKKVGIWRKPITVIPKEVAETLKELKEKNVFNPQYHSSWDWLMPVVEKIQKLDSCRFYFHVDPFSIMCVDYKENEKDIFILEFTSDDDVLIDRWYEAVQTFIQWYNKNKT